MIANETNTEGTYLLIYNDKKEFEKADVYEGHSTRNKNLKSRRD